jgi:hypothetical protein
MLGRELAEFAEYQSYRVEELFENLSCCFGASPLYLRKGFAFPADITTRDPRLCRRLRGRASKDPVKRERKSGAFPQIERHSRKEPRTELLVAARGLGPSGRAQSLVLRSLFVVGCSWFVDLWVSVSDRPCNP